jgi:hypothetical protein
MVRALRALIEFIYIARRNVLDTGNIQEMRKALVEFHQYREIFVETGVRKPNDIPPRQHSLMHYPKFIREFGAPNGLCSSITESRHISAVKKPWRRSNRYNALGQMLVTNQRLDQLAITRVEIENYEDSNLDELPYSVYYCHYYGLFV